jgi:TrmH family RNA methyltransferase
MGKTMLFSEDIIRSRQNRTVVEVAKLADRKHREAERKFRFDGIKLFEEARRNGLVPETVLLRASGAEALCAELYRRCGSTAFDGIGRVLLLQDDIFDRISEEKSPEGVICTAKYIDKFQKKITIYNSADFLHAAEERIVLLESVRDPSNLGAIIRSAAAFGIDRLIVSDDCADMYNAKTVRASMGTLFSQRIDRATDLAAAIEALRANGRRVFAAALDESAERLGDFTIQKGDCAVIGNEGHGLSQRVIAACGRTVYIPMTERAESLNAAVAASVLMWTFSREH